MLSKNTNHMIEAGRWTVMDSLTGRFNNLKQLLSNLKKCFKFYWKVLMNHLIQK